jgi:tripartite-type tricarboxylate transporter receptor subunit TctC
MRIAHLAGLAVALLMSAAQAQTIPKQISIIVPYPPGSTSDILPRMLAPHVAQALGVSIIVENVPGANGSIGAQRVARASADGSQILMAPTGVLSTNQFLYSKLSYDPETSFEPLINLASTPNLIVVNKDLPASNLPELIKLAQSKPGSISFGSAGVGSTSHLCGEMLRTAAKTEILHVPFRGPAPAKQAVLAGDVSIICDNLSNVIQDARAGSLKPIALSATKRHPRASEIPTAAEQGYPMIDAGIWYSLVAPKGTPPAIVERLNREFAKALNLPEVKSKLDNLALTIVADSPAAFGAFLKAETARWKQAIEEAGVKVE